ncbi:hypothetical protein [Streptomyces sp. CMB-StM0423]|uniref:hypothetical protein n=1 Tax=Streptomyces sp. CMB-StM0423 TaxID=2059884 RepID=UPI000C70DE8C|nr:hypothetical protein [Streptomyces sp. CMB-StM0423]AUH44553.1 hypothetical protein CXR04_34095 [Streptomyces sp. CMB-StM0423]
MPVDVLPALAAGRPVDGASWHDLWERAARKALRPGEAVGVVASLSTRLPDADSVVALLDSLDARRDPLPAPWPGTVNPVGTGGGPATFDIPTAAALLAAAMGIRVVKTGSTGRSGSLDALADLRPAGPGEPAETHLPALLRGEGPAAARETVCLNAAVAAVAALAAGADQSLAEAFHAAEDALRDGAAVGLVERLRARRGTGTARQVAGVRA